MSGNENRESQINRFNYGTYVNRRSATARMEQLLAVAVKDPSLHTDISYFVNNDPFLSPIFFVRVPRANVLVTDWNTQL